MRARIVEFTPRWPQSSVWLEAVLHTSQPPARIAAWSVRLIAADLLEGIPDEFDVVLSNPPYVPNGDRLTLAPEILRHEPASALLAGSNRYRVGA